MRAKEDNADCKRNQQGRCESMMGCQRERARRDQGPMTTELLREVTVRPALLGAGSIR